MNQTNPIERQNTAVPSRKFSSRVIGALFPLGFLSYGAGFALVTSVTGGPDFLSNIAAHQTVLALGAFLMLLNSLVDVGKGVLFFPILKPYGERVALGYLSAMIIEVVFLGIGVLSLLMVVPIAQSGATAGVSTALGALAIGTNTMAYQIAETSLALGGVMLCARLFRTRLVPGWLAVFGVLGYLIFMTGTIAEIFGLHIGLMLTLPGGLFELAVGFWLLMRGFEPRAYAAAAA